MSTVPDRIAERGLPASVDAEKAVLGAVVLENDLAIELLASLKRDELSLTAHRRIYTAIAELVNAARPIDTLTLAEELGPVDLKAVGGIAYLSALTDGVPRRASIEHYVKIIRQKAALRSMIHLAHGAEALAMDPPSQKGDDPSEDPVENCISRFETAVLNLRAGYSTERERTLTDRIRDTLNAIHVEYSSEREFLGYRFGIKPLDESLMGIRRKELVLVAAPPGRAKTAMALQLASTTAEESRDWWLLQCERRDAGEPEPKVRDAVAMFSLEMADDPLLRRLLAAKSKVPARFLRNVKQLSPEQKEQIEQAGAQLSELENFLLLDDTGRLKISELISRARLNVRSRGVGLVIVDHIGLVQCEGRLDKNERLIKVTDELRNFAKVENVCVVMLYHTAKPPERDINRIPTMFDVRDATEITDNSHIILLPFREVMTEKLIGDAGLPSNLEVNDFTGRDMIFVGKHRESEVGGVPVRFQKRSLQYVERV
jgi:replicative DNA helicase